MPDNNKVALFIDFDNIRIGIRQHFGGELHPQKLMNKASKYGRVVTARAYADFTGHPKEFQDRLLFAAGIEPIHAPSKISGGRRQSSADMHMVIDMFLEAIDNQDVDTFVLMTGDADFVRMVATLRRRFGRKVIVSGVQSTSTSLDLMNAADARDPITRQDVDMTGELGRMTRPLVTRADLDAQQAAVDQESARPKKRGGILGALFNKKEPAAPAPTSTLPAVTPPPAAPRRLRATELQRSRSSSPSGSPRTRATAGPAPTGGRPAASPRTPGRSRQPQELPPVAPGSEPDEFEKKLIVEIFLMPPGRSGFNTIKTIEEVLRSKAGSLGGTRKEIPTRLDRLEAMGLFKREMRSRGAIQVPTGELVLDNPLVQRLTAGVNRPEAKPRLPRSPRPARGTAREPRAAEAEAAGPTAAPEEPASAISSEAVATEQMTTEAAPEGVVEVEAEVAAAEAEEPAAAAPAEAPTTPFRWVSGAPAVSEKPGETEETAKAPSKRRPAARKTTGTRAKARTSRSTKTETTSDPEPDPQASSAQAPGAAEAVDDKEPSPA
ncbi:MAG TPA: NYN domain-containing protein [Candidatus Dormibacteraeota bacterium]|nr:NYN domain-containing protein [Candidatus Dormibacteraeota bacterium]